MLSDEGPMLETLDYTIRIGSIPTFLYFDLYLYSAYAAHFERLGSFTILFVVQLLESIISKIFTSNDSQFSTKSFGTIF